MNNSYIIADTRVVPEVFLKVIAAKRNMASGKCRTVNEAIESANISRSAFYKYKDYVFAFSEKNNESIYTLFFTLADVTGILSDILSVLAAGRCSVLTINQNIPLHEIANITISFRADADFELDKMLEELNGIEGISKIELLAMGAV